MKLLKRILRSTIPLSLLAVGIALLVYGVRSHTIPVVRHYTVERTIMVPAPPDEFAMGPPMDPGMGPPGMEQPGGDDQWMPEPRMKKETVYEPVREVSEVAEPAIVKDVTVGGVVRVKYTPDADREDGGEAEEGNDKGQRVVYEIQRTYSPGEGPPSVCPT